MGKDTGSEPHRSGDKFWRLWRWTRGGGSGNVMYFRLRTQSLEDDSLMTPASAEISCPAGIIISR